MLFVVGFHKRGTAWRDGVYEGEFLMAQALVRGGFAATRQPQSGGPLVRSGPQSVGGKEYVLFGHSVEPGLVWASSSYFGPVPEDQPRTRDVPGERDSVQLASCLLLADELGTRACIIAFDDSTWTATELRPVWRRRTVRGGGCGVA